MMMLITTSIILKAMFSSETPESITQMKSAVETMITYVETQMVPVRVPTWVPTRRNHRHFEARDLVHGSIDRHPLHVKTLVKGHLRNAAVLPRDASPRSGHYGGRWVAAPPSGPLSPSFSVCVDALGDDGFA